MSLMKPAISKHANEESSGLLFSALYLWLEMKKQNFPKTSEILRQSIEVFFQEMQEQGRSTDDYVRIKGFLDKILLLNDAQMSDYISYLGYTESTDN